MKSKLTWQELGAMVVKQRRQKNLKLQGEMAVKVDGLVKIPLTKGKWAIVDEADYEMVRKHKWCARKSGAHFYVASSTYINGIVEKIHLHRAIMKADCNQVVDHRDRDGLNNRRSNLRVCTMGQNRLNSKVQRNSKLGIKGVMLTEYGTYKVRIATKDKVHFLKSFKNLKDAVLGYNEAAKRIYGEFACLNQI